MDPQYASTVGTASPQPALDDSVDESINLQIFVPELQMQKCLTVSLDDLVWDIKRKLFSVLPQALPQSFNFGLFLPPCDGRAGKFLLEDRPIRQFSFNDCVPYLELKYKKRVYKMLKLDEKALKQLHSKSNLKKFMDYVVARNSEKIDKWCAQGLDPNFHDSTGETPLTLAAGIAKNRDVIMSLIGGGAHIDFRNSEGQTAIHKAAFLSMTDNVKTLLELGGSPNCRDPIGLTPLYYNVLTPDSQENVAQMLLSEGSDLGITDMHGNIELHQACKNGLVKHVETILYYGAEINAQNINGNTALIVTAVNNRPDCARVLLFRGADPFIMNKQCQTALHVANIVGNAAIAQIIQNHNPNSAVPYRGTPQFNTRRRAGSQIIRRRSMSQSSLCSAQSTYQAPQSVRHTPSVMPSPSPSRASVANNSDYGTLRRYPPEAVNQQMPGFEPNTPRILVIPRGPKGFGFILRGTKHIDSAMDFQPTPEIPALQFFEGVEMSGMAMKAGLRPGDFLLEINGVDVRCSNHEQVVQLIHQSQETITLKVITVASGVDFSPQQHYATTAGTLPIRGRGSKQMLQKFGPLNGLPPTPPQRNPNTTLSYAHHTMGGYSPDIPSDHSSSNFVYQPPGDSRLSTTKSSDAISIQSIDSLHYSDQNRCASVKSRPCARRISAAELEHLMMTQQSTSQFQPIPYEQDSLNGGPKKFTSVADMKRRKQKNGMPSPSMNRLPRTISSEDQPIYEAQHQPLKSFSSSPDLQARIYDQGPSAFQPHVRKQSIESTAGFSDYSKPARVLRPKTPPPPPPALQSYEPPAAVSTARLPPPPPPPPPGFLNSTTPKPKNDQQNAAHQNPSTSTTDAAKSDCRGISAAALTGVRLKPVNSNNNIPTNQASSSSAATPSAPAPKVLGKKPPLDFDSDLRNALSKRRSKVCADEDSDESGSKTPENVPVQKALIPNPTASNGRYGGLSLRESVRENVQPPSKTPAKQHSPPGFVNKKDSGYTSSRTSLEPSECGDDQQTTPLAVTPTSSPNTTTIRITENPSVTLISQQLEDSFITQQTIVQQPCKPQYNDTVSIASTLSSISNYARRTPPIDYEEQDSGTGGDSDHDSCATVAPSAISNDSGLPTTTVGTNQYEQKKLTEWDCGDVYDWLIGLGLTDYATDFLKRNITGSALKNSDRAFFTKLNVTRVSHRQQMQNSIKEHAARNP